MHRLYDKDTCYFAKTNFREDRRTFGIKLQDRLQHFYILGRSGSGKSTLIHNKISQDLMAEHGLCLIDFHGDLMKKVLQTIPQHRQKDVVFLDATDPNLELGYNPLRKVSYEKRPLIVSNILQVFQKLWGSQSWGIKLSHILRNVLLLLTDQKEATLADIIRVLQDSDYRNQCLQYVVSKDVKNFFEKEFKEYSQKTDFLPIYNKLGGLLSYPAVKRILVTNQKQISLRQIMDQGKILLVHIPKGSLGTEASSILGSLLVTSIASASFSRIDTLEEERKTFFCYWDEFQSISTLSVVEMMSELRKFKVGLIIAHQYISQLDPKIRDAVLSNVGTIVAFRTSQADAKFLEREFSPVFEASDFVNLPNYEIYLKLMIDGTPSKAFSATTLPPPP